MNAGEIIELPATPKGFRCRYAFEKGAVWVQVQERRLLIQGETESAFQSGWFLHSNTVAFFPVSRERAQAIIEHNVRFFDSALVETLTPIWEAWDSAPLLEPPPGDGRAPAGPVN